MLELSLQERAALEAAMNDCTRLKSERESARQALGICKTDATPAVVSAHTPERALPALGVVGIPSGQDRFAELCKRNFDGMAWEAWTRWARETYWARRDFALGRTDQSGPYLLRDFSLCGERLSIDDLAIKYGTCLCKTKPCRGTCGAARTDRQAYDLVSGWIVEHGGLDAGKAREIMAKHRPNRLPEFDALWRRAFQIAVNLDNAARLSTVEFGIDGHAD